MTATIGTPYALGRNHKVEPLRLVKLRHLHDGLVPLRTVDHEPSLAVLDQQDLDAQGIDTSLLIPGAPKVDELGSCVLNATTAHLASLMSQSAFCQTTGATSWQDTKGAEEYAIKLYARTTARTADPSSEWPPTDCGSSGLDACEELESEKVIATHKTAVGATNIVSLLQTGTLILGQPWFNAAFQPDSSGFVDGDGSQSALLGLIDSGEAGGHETLVTAVEKLGFNPDGTVDPTQTVVRCRNSWAASWGDHGSYRYHLQTIIALGPYVDLRQMVLAA